MIIYDFNFFIKENLMQPFKIILTRGTTLIKFANYKF